MADDDKKDYVIPYGGGREANPEDWDNEPVALAIERARLAAQIEPHHQDGPVVNQAHDAVDTTTQLWPRIQPTGLGHIPKVVEMAKPVSDAVNKATHDTHGQTPENQPAWVKAAVNALLGAHSKVEEIDKEAQAQYFPKEGENGMSRRDLAMARAYPIARDITRSYYNWAKDLVGSKKKQ